MSQNKLNITANFSIEAAAVLAENEKPKNRRFSMTAYTGGPMMLEGWKCPVVIDLQGLNKGSSSRPIFISHNQDIDDLLGQTDHVNIVENNLVAAGVVLGDSPRVQRVIALADKGFNWQASIGARAEQIEYIKAGQNVSVNGKEFTGPLNIARKSMLGEISFVTLGADNNTSATIAANFQEQTMENLENQETNKKEETTITAETTIADIRAAAAAETTRITAIKKICSGKYDDIEAKAIAEGWDQPKCELEVLRASRPNVNIITSQKITATPKVYEAVALMASGIAGSRLEKFYDNQTLEQADKLRGIGIQEYCEQICAMQLPRFRRDASAWLSAAFSTASLPGILSNVANKMLLEGYSYIEDAWRKICKIASVNDFKEHSRYRMTGSFKFEQVGADGELKHGKIDEQKYGQKADTHGIMFALTRQMIINDDLAAFTDVPRQIGMGAAEAIADAVWALLLSNPSSFFSAAHKNFKDGADTALSGDSLTDAEVVFGEQTKPNGKPLGIQPSIILVPTALRVPADLLMKSPMLNETTTANKGKPSSNPHIGKYDVVSSSYLSNSSFTGYSSKAWYLFADPNRLPALEVAFLNGIDQPIVEKTDADFNTLGIQFRGFIDFGVREQDFRGAVKFKGEI
ncbi:MAG: hypothetical protein A2Y10_02485 [Planctomycetes bacterium GWF2_41_51]|nr:MAG: hypothetical protein A2Y10_02485 [Planctomycetes bacterium GWF2_41_51]HBG25673.1 hypothetical protein [Phycisphaerales bacterium]